MKKILLSLVTVLAIIAFVPEASALPLFARQTGMACNACHYQHFPLLNPFGRAFKASAFTLVGAQGKIEGDNLSIPDTVNMGVFVTSFFQTQSAGQTGGVDNAVDPNVPKWGVPGTGGELSIFFGGRISDFAGFLSEAGLSGSPVAANGKLVLLFPVDDARVGTVMFSSNDQGAAYGFEFLNTGAVGVHKMMGNSGPTDQHIRAAYAAQYLGTSTAATGIALVANNGMGFVNLSAYEMAGNEVVGGGNNLDLTYMRLVFTTDIGNWDAAFGIQNFGGKSTSTCADNVVMGTAPDCVSSVTANAPKATIIDAQLQGDVGTMPAGLYVSYGTAAAGSATEINVFNPKGSTVGTTATSFNVAGELGVIPHTTVQVAVRLAKNGASSDSTDNALMLGVTYQMAQNMYLSFHHTQQSGSAWTGSSVAGNEPAGKTGNTLLLQTSF